MNPFELRGEEVLLRPLLMGDAEALTTAAAESRIHYAYNNVPDGLNQVREYIQNALDRQVAGDKIPFTIVWRDRVVGTTSYYDLRPWSWPPGHPLQRLDRPDAVDVGYTWLAASAQRTRCNTESKYLLFSHAFDVWDVHRIALRTDERNQRSRRAIERLGVRFEGIRRADRPAQDGVVRNTAYYSVVRSEWPQVRQHLQRLLAGRGGQTT